MRILPAALSVVLGTTVMARAAELPPPSALPAVPGYLDAAHTPDAAQILPPPPPAGSAAQQNDRDVFTRSRALAGSPRFTLAAHDAQLAPADLANSFSCAAGVQLGANTPALVTLLGRMEADAEHATTHAKQVFAVVRPQVGNTQPICVPRSAALDRSPAYPSGHTTIGWATGLILTALLPERATPLLQRARVFGESRLVCGVHWVSDVEAGRTNGAAVFAALQADSGFQKDLAAARAELAALHTAPPVGICAAEREAAQIRP